jgi:hypothetical protein
MPPAANYVGLPEAIKYRALLRVTGVQTTANRGTDRNPGATEFLAFLPCPRLTPISREAEGSCQKRPCVVPDVTAARWRRIAR